MNDKFILQPLLIFKTFMLEFGLVKNGCFEQGEWDREIKENY